MVYHRHTTAVELIIVLLLGGQLVYQGYSILKESEYLAEFNTKNVLLIYNTQE